jgi:hypothetical protein
MNCQKFENLVSELARDQMMAAEQRGEALAHSDACEDCSTRLRDEEMLTRGLQSLAAEMESLAASDDVEVKLLEAFRAQRVVVPVASRRSGSRYWLAAVAAMLLIVMSVIAIRWRTAGEDNHRQTASTTNDKKEVKNPSQDSVKDVEFKEDVVPQRPSKRPGRRSTLPKAATSLVANRVTPEIATDFIPLSSMSAANLQDGGQIVRLELPRSALANFGLPVNMDRYNEKVKADVLFGVDGLAHAIRFVQ